ERLQRVRARSEDEAAAIRVAVEVRDRVAAQLIPVLLRPLRRAQQAPLLAVPRGEDDGACRPPAGLEQRSHRARTFLECYQPRDGILGAVHPGVVMIAVDD